MSNGTGPYLIVLFYLGLVFIATYIHSLQHSQATSYAAVANSMNQLGFV